MSAKPTGLRGFLKSGIQRLSAFAGIGGGSDAYEGSRTWGKGLVYINPNPSDSEAQANPWTRRVLSGLSSHLYRNVGFARGTVNAIARHSVGSGMFPYSMIKDQGRAEEYDDHWRQWCNICDVAGRFDFTTLLEMTSKAADAEGDLGWGMVTTDTDYPRLQVFRSHRIESEKDEDGWCDGVKRNAVGQHVAYSVRARTLDGEDKFIKFPASSFILVGDPDRPDEVRYVPGLAHAILHMRDKKDILGFEKLGVKTASSLALKVKRKDDPTSSFFGAKTTASDGAGGTREFEAMAGGGVININPDEDVDIFNSNRPSPTFTGFLEYLDRDVAIGCGVPLEFVWDASKLGGTSQRFVLQLAQHRFEQRQRMLSRAAFRVRNWVIAKAIKRGDLPFDPDWWRVEWQFCSKITVDVGREAQANREDYFAGLRTGKEDYSERGASFLSARRENERGADDLLARAERLMLKYASTGISIKDAIELLEKRGNSGSPPSLPGGQTTATPAKQEKKA